MGKSGRDPVENRRPELPLQSKISDGTDKSGLGQYRTLILCWHLLKIFLVKRFRIRSQVSLTCNQELGMNIMTLLSKRIKIHDFFELFNFNSKVHIAAPIEWTGLILSSRSAIQFLAPGLPVRFQDLEADQESLNRTRFWPVHFGLFPCLLVSDCKHKPSLNR